MLLALLVGNSAHAADAVAATPWWSSLSTPPTLEALGINSWADIPRDGLWSANLSSAYDSQHQGIRMPDSAERRFSGRLTNTSLNISNNAWALLDPGLLTGNIGLGFSLQRSRQDAGGSSFEQQGRLADYSFDALVLGRKPVSATILANRAQSQSTQASGGVTQTVSENRRITLRIQENNLLRDKEILPWFSANVRFAQEHFQENTQVAGQSFQRDDEHRLLGFDAHNGFETADLDFRYEHNDVVNHLYLPGSYGSQLAGLKYSLDFGPTLNRHWDSRLDFSSRGGSSPTTTFSAKESLGVEHYANLSSTYDYQVDRQRTPDGTATAHNGSVSLQHQLYGNLSTNLGINGNYQIFPGGVRDSKGAQLSLNYSHDLPWHGQLSASMGGNAAVNRNRLQSSYLAVFDASYQAPPQFGAGASFALKDLFIVPETIVVIDVKGSARIPTALGVDYLLVSEGNQTQIVPLATSAIIQPGDLLEITYVFQLDPSVIYESVSRSASLGADWQWMGVTLTHDATDQKPLEGGDSSYLVSSRRDAVRVYGKGEWDIVQTRAEATASHYYDSMQEYRENRFSEFLLYQPTVNWTLSLNAEQHRTDYATTQRTSLGDAVVLTANWLAPGGWTANFNLSRRQRTDTRMPFETTSEASLKMQRRWLKLNVVARLGLTELVRGDVQSTNAMLYFGIVRHF